MNFHELTEKRWIGEVEVVRHFLHAHVGVLQFVFDLFDGMFVDNLQWGLSCCLFDDGAYVFRTIT